MMHSGGKNEEKRNESGAKERMKKLGAKAGMLGCLLLLAGCFCEPPPPKTDWTVTILAVGLTAITCFLAGSLTMSEMKEQYERSLKEKEAEQQEAVLRNSV